MRTTKSIFFEDAVEATFRTESDMNEALRQMPRALEPSPGRGRLDVVFDFPRAEWEPTLLCEVAAALTGLPEEAFYALTDRAGGTVAGFVAGIEGFSVSE